MSGVVIVEANTTCADTDSSQLRGLGFPQHDLQPSPASGNPPDAQLAAVNAQFAEDRQHVRAEIADVDAEPVIAGGLRGLGGLGGRPRHPTQQRGHQRNGADKQ
ncbi:MAG: hypothetical protein M3425_02845 [Actinomycetota bacterium]|nr:hypothetical protein [Actinomycetota bacterium]